MVKMPKMKPAYKMKKAEIINELKEVYGCDASDIKYKRDLVYRLQSARMGDCCQSSCECKDERDDLQEVNVMDDKTAWNHFWNMFKFWN